MADKAAIVRLLAARSQFLGDVLRHLAMANIHSQKKRILRAERERLENRRYTSTIKTYFRRLESTMESGGDSTTADTEHRELVSTIDKAVKRGALHRNTGARKKARAARVRAGAPSS
jgi:small subunit ribosomal protein S20